MPKGGKKSRRPKYLPTRRPGRKLSQPRQNYSLLQPITRFSIPTHSWKMPSIQVEQMMMAKNRFCYSQPKQVKFQGQLLLSVSVTRNTEFQGYIYVPPRYENLWRHLRYSILYWEKALLWYEAKVKAFGVSLNEREEAMQTLRDNAGVKYVQYMICQREVLGELMLIQFDRVHELFLPQFVEFGIRHFRDWLHDDFSYAHRAGSSYLAMDPTEPANEAKFKAGYHGKMPAEMDPPSHDDWWDGQFDLSPFFSKNIKTTLAVMVKQEFEDSRICLADDNEEPVWRECSNPSIDFFSPAFDRFLFDHHKDPRQHPKKYLEIYYKDADKNLDLVKECFWWEVGLLLGNEFHENRESWDERIASLDDESSWRDVVDEIVVLMTPDDVGVGNGDSHSGIVSDEGGEGQGSGGRDKGKQSEMEMDEADSADDRGTQRGGKDTNEESEGSRGEQADIDRAQDGSQAVGPSNIGSTAGAQSLESQATGPPQLGSTEGEPSSTGPEDFTADWDRRKAELLR